MNDRLNQMPHLTTGTPPPWSINGPAVANILVNRASNDGVIQNQQVDITLRAAEVVRDWQHLGRVAPTRPDLRPDVVTEAAVIERVPRMQQRFLQSKYLGFLASRYYRNNSFSMSEQLAGVPQAGEPGLVRDRQRYVVRRRAPALVVPHAVIDEHTGPKRKPDARMPTNPEPNRHDALILSLDQKSLRKKSLLKRDSWASGIRASDGTMFVGEDISPIGVDKRPLRRTRLPLRIMESVLDTFGIYRRLSPNAAARGVTALLPRLDHPEEIGDPLQLEAGINRLRGIDAKLRAIGHYAVTGAGPLPSDPADRRTAHYDQRELVRPGRYQGAF